MEKTIFATVHLCPGILLFDFIALHGIFVYKKTDCILAVHANYGDNQLSFAYKWIYAFFLPVALSSVLMAGLCFTGKGNSFH